MVSYLENADTKIYASSLTQSLNENNNNNNNDNDNNTNNDTINTSLTNEHYGNNANNSNISINTTEINNNANIDTSPNSNTVKKCSRCRVKRLNEPIETLSKYATCSNCREKRRVIKTSVDNQLPNTFTDYNEFLNHIKLNTSQDLLDYRFRGETDPLIFKRFGVEAEVNNGIYQLFAKQLVELYIHPLMNVTGYRFPVRDYHKGGRKIKKIAFMFICSQDRNKQRKHKLEDTTVKNNNNNNNINTNKLKVEFCESKITLTYSLNDGIVQILYNHKYHAPYTWKKSKEHETGNGNGNGGSISEFNYKSLDLTNKNSFFDGSNSNSNSTTNSTPNPIDQQRFNLLDVSNQYNQLQNLSQYNNQLQFGQFHIPLTQQYRSQNGSSNTFFQSQIPLNTPYQSQSTSQIKPSPKQQTPSQPQQQEPIRQSQTQLNPQLNIPISYGSQSNQDSIRKISQENDQNYTNSNHTSFDETNETVGIIDDSVHHHQPDRSTTEENSNKRVRVGNESTNNETLIDKELLSLK